MAKYLLLASFLLFVSMCVCMEPTRRNFFGNVEKYEYLGKGMAMAFPSTIHDRNFTFIFPEVYSTNHRIIYKQNFKTSLITS